MLSHVTRTGAVIERQAGEGKGRSPGDFLVSSGPGFDFLVDHRSRGILFFVHSWEGLQLSGSRYRRTVGQRGIDWNGPGSRRGTVFASVDGDGRAGHTDQDDRGTKGRESAIRQGKGGAKDCDAGTHARGGDGGSSAGKSSYTRSASERP